MHPPFSFPYTAPYACSGPEDGHVGGETEDAEGLASGDAAGVSSALPEEVSLGVCGKLSLCHLDLFMCLRREFVLHMALGRATDKRRCSGRTPNRCPQTGKNTGGCGQKWRKN